jgi:exodeoxyribonuclease VII large subunit
MAKQIRLNLGLKSPSDIKPESNKNTGEPDQSQSSEGQLKEKDIFTVKGITYYIKRILEKSPDLQDIWIRGELSNITHHASGHLYFTLKEDGANLSCVKFRGSGRKVNFEMDDGIKVLAHGKIGVYPPQGKYQFIVDEIRPDGVGALHQAFLQLKERLTKEGLFEDIHKKPLPAFPKIIGIATSITGAALRDIINIISRRFPAVTLYITPTQVQGEGSAESIVRSIKMLDDRPEVDVIIVGRGGGSIEDLWSFNEEMAVRAVYKAKHPVISAVGHQTDITLVDFAADRVAPTPSAAAEIVVPDGIELIDNLDYIKEKLRVNIANTLNRFKLGLNNQIESYAFQRPLERVREGQQNIDDLMARNASALRKSMRIKLLEFQGINGRLLTLDPGSVLNRGYSITFSGTKPGKIINSISSVKSKDEVEVILKDGKLICKIEDLYEVSDPLKYLLSIKRKKGKLKS